MARTMQKVVLFRRLVIGLGATAIAVLALLELIAGNWVVTLLLLFVGEPVWYLIADIATGILVAPFVGVAALRGRRRR